MTAVGGREWVWALLTRRPPARQATTSTSPARSAPSPAGSWSRASSTLWLKVRGAAWAGQALCSLRASWPDRALAAAASTAGWVVAKPSFFQDASGNYLSDTWKEYSKADSRYATRDSFIISMEAITAFVWGPLCPLVVYGIFARSAWRYTLMVIVSLGQIYGDVLYYGTCFLEGEVAQRPAALPAASGAARTRWVTRRRLAAPLPRRLCALPAGGAVLLALFRDHQRLLDHHPLCGHRPRLGQDQHGGGHRIGGRQEKGEGQGQGAARALLVEV